MSGNADAITELRGDDRRWWIRWVDSYSLPHRASSMAAVSVWAQAIPDYLRDIPLHALDTREVIAARTDRKIVRLLVGMLPRLTLGAVFQDGVQIGSLPTITKTFRFQRGRAKVHHLRVAEEIDGAKYPWMQRGLTPVGRTAYELKEFSKSHCLVIEQDRDFLVIPCSEALRIFYAPITAMANTVFSGPLGKVWPQLVNPETTCRRPDGSWQVGLRRDIPDDFRLQVGAMLFDPIGRAQAKGIHRQLASAINGAHIQVGLPFEWDDLVLKVRCIRQDDWSNRYLCYRILATSWPTPDRDIHWTRDNSGDPGIVQVPTELPKPYASAGAKADIVDEAAEVKSEADPERSAVQQKFFAEGFHWINPPAFHKVEKEVSKIYDTPSYRPEDDAQNLPSSAGDPHWGQSGLGQADYAAVRRRDASARFSQVINLLGGMLREGKIDHWSILRPSVLKHYRDNLEVWGLPLPDSCRLSGKRPPGWLFIDRERKYRRTALVCSIQRSGMTLYWLEIETRSKESGYRYVLFAAIAGSECQVATELMKEASEHRGIWPSAQSLIGSTGALYIACPKHTYINQGNGSVDEESAEAELSANGIYKAFNEVM